MTSLVARRFLPRLEAAPNVSPFGRLQFLHALPRLRPALVNPHTVYLEAAMTPRRTKTLRMPSCSAEPLRVQNPHAAGIDIHAAEHWVAVSPDQAPPPHDHPPQLPPHIRRFGACTADLELLADWLQACHVTTVAMESTGVYWIPLFELLERRGFQVFLVDPRQTRQVSGRPKTDVLDCQWIQRLHCYGLLAASFRPEDQVVVLRSYLRQRHMLLRYTGQHIQHLQKALEQMNVKLTEVVSDITGLTGLAIIRALLAGQRDPLQLAKLRDARCHRTEAEIARRCTATGGRSICSRCVRPSTCTSFTRTSCVPATRPSSGTCRPLRTRAAATSCHPPAAAARANTRALPTSMSATPCIVSAASI